MKSGANFRDMNQIRRLAGLGKKAPQIAEQLKIELSVVEAFMPKAKKVTTNAS
jgi:hypothetical protein